MFQVHNLGYNNIIGMKQLHRVISVILTKGRLVSNAIVFKSVHFNIIMICNFVIISIMLSILLLSITYTTEYYTYNSVSYTHLTEHFVRSVRKTKKNVA